MNAPELIERSGDAISGQSLWERMASALRAVAQLQQLICRPCTVSTTASASPRSSSGTVHFMEGRRRDADQSTAGACHRINRTKGRSDAGTYDGNLAAP